MIHKEPLIILDGATTPGARVLAEFIKGKLAGRKIICVFGILATSATGTHVVHRALVSSDDNHVPILQGRWTRKTCPEARRYTPNVTIEEDSDKAMELAITKASSDDVVLCCALYLVGPARTYIRKRFGISPYGGE